MRCKWLWIFLVCYCHRAGNNSLSLNKHMPKRNPPIVLVRLQYILFFFIIVSSVNCCSVGHSFIIHFVINFFFNSSVAQKVDQEVQWWQWNIQLDISKYKGLFPGHVQRKGQLEFPFTWQWDSLSPEAWGGGGGLLYISYTGMWRGEGDGFQAV